VLNNTISFYPSQILINHSPNISVLIIIQNLIYCLNENRFNILKVILLLELITINIIFIDIKIWLNYIYSLKIHKVTLFL
jgi:hypothetical protein